MPFMKSGQPWLFDDATGDIVGVKDPDGSERFFADRRKTEVFWQFAPGQVLNGDTNYNLINWLKTRPAPSTGQLGGMFFNTATDKINAFDDDASLHFKLTLAGTWTGGSNRSIQIDFLGTNGNRILENRNDAVTSDVFTLQTFFSIDRGGNIVSNGTAPVIRANGGPFSVISALLIAEQMTSLPNISVR
jgi:hypothetical protein